jgi:hypothetical protein
MKAGQSRTTLAPIEVGVKAVNPKQAYLDRLIKVMFCHAILL